MPAVISSSSRIKSHGSTDERYATFRVLQFSEPGRKWPIVVVNDVAEHVKLSRSPWHRPCIKLGHVETNRKKSILETGHSLRLSSQEYQIGGAEIEPFDTLERYESPYYSMLFRLLPCGDRRTSGAAQTGNLRR
jgi:hypothetical protein